jgi:site-specific DNA-methyltransferase (adenine-specific)
MTTIADVLSGRAQWCALEADCSDVLPMLPPRSVDHVISDPPYSEHTHAKVRRGGSFHAPDRTDGVKRPVISTSAVLGFEALTPTLREAVAAEAARLVRRWVLLFSDAESAHEWATALTEQGLEHVRIGAWIKIGGTPQFTGDRPGIGYEAIEIAHPKGRKRWNGGGTHGVWAHTICQGDGRVHTTQKPLPLLIELVELFTNPGEIILDPFCGSGSLGQACVRLGRRYIGLDNGKDADGKPWAQWAREGIRAEEQGLSRGAARAGQLGLFASPG